MNIDLVRKDGCDFEYGITNDSVKARRVQCVEYPVGPGLNSDVFKRLECGLSRLLQVTGYIGGLNQRNMKYLLDCFSNII